MSAMQRLRKLGEHAGGLTALVAVLALLQFAPKMLSLPTYIFPPLSTVLLRMSADASYLAAHSATTFSEAFAGLVLAAVFGIGIGVATRPSRSIAAAGLSSASILQTIPIVAVAPLIILWAGPGFTSKVVMATLIGAPPLIIASIQGFRAPPDDLIAALEVMGCTPRQIMVAVRFPYAFKQIAIGLRVSAALTTIGAIVAEYAGSTKGIGYVIMQSSYRLDTVLMFAAVILAVAIGLLLVGMVRVIDNLVTYNLSRR